jgi:DNA-binding CsgD family transcriptional regulator/GAF domain-containing protein
MSNLFQSLIHEIATAGDESQLRHRYMDSAGKLFHAQHSALYLYSTETSQPQIELHGLPDSFIDYYQDIGAALDPFMPYITTHHIPVHEGVLFTEKQWQQSPLYTLGCGKIYNHEHVLSGPIVGNGRLIGSVHFARTLHTPGFTTQDLFRLSAVCAHISATLAACRQPLRSSALDLLTPREQQIAMCVARGLTNTEIGTELWITQNSVKQALKRMFLKLNVSARAELVARL